MEINTQPNTVDLFSGAGGFSFAAREAGCRIVLAVENDAASVLTFKRNICNLGNVAAPEVYDKDILALDAMQLNKKHFSKTSCDLLLGGPPCQGFSTHRILDAGIDDPRNELIHAYFDFVKELRPKVFLMENVPGILWERHKPYLDRFYAEGAAAGYVMQSPETLDARDYGVPQRRKRVFILGVRSDIADQNFIWPPAPTHADAKINDGTLYDWISCAHAFEPAVHSDANDIHMNHGPELITAFENTPPNGGSRKDSGRVLPCHENHDGHKDVYGRIDPSQPAPTMTTACINPSKGRFVHPTEHHGITARQAARIQTFPDTFEFSGGITVAGRQIGNAVPVKLGKVLIEHIKISLLTPSSKGDEVTPARLGVEQQDRSAA